MEKQRKPQPLALYALQAKIIDGYQLLGYTMPQEELERIRSIATLQDAATEAQAVTVLVTLAKEQEALAAGRRHQEWLAHWRELQDDAIQYGDMG